MERIIASKNLVEANQLLKRQEPDLVLCDVKFPDGNGVDFIKLGDTKISKANVRLIAATNRDLKTAIEKGEFREDLYYWLNVFTIELPALRERTGDILLPANFFLQQFLAKQNKTSLHISKDAMKLLQQYNWKGNIRELKNVLERAVILVDNNEILPEHLPSEIQKQNTGASHQLSLAADGRCIRFFVAVSSILEN